MQVGVGKGYENISIEFEIYIKKIPWGRGGGQDEVLAYLQINLFYFHPRLGNTEQTESGNV
jgi:hypothetical protein